MPSAPSLTAASKLAKVFSGNRAEAWRDTISYAILFLWINSRHGDPNILNPLC